MIWKRFFFLILLGSSSLFSIDDLQYWASVRKTLYDSKPVEFSLLGETRMMDTVSNPRFHLISPQLKLDVHPNLDMGLHYTYIRSKARGRNSLNQNWLELQATPHFTRDNWKFDTRMRLEFRWIESLEGAQPRFRHRLQVTHFFSTQNSLRALFASNEYFYDLKKGSVNQNRLVPLGLRFKLNESATLSLFSLFQSIESLGKWTTNTVVGTYLDFR